MFFTRPFLGLALALPLLLSQPAVADTTGTLVRRQASSTTSSSSSGTGGATAICKPSSCGRNGDGPACPKAQSNSNKKVRRGRAFPLGERSPDDLPSPSDYDGNMDTFMTTLFGKDSTKKVSLPAGIVSSSATQSWSDSKDDGLALGVAGLFGCGSIIITSRKGVWMSHHWQDGFDDDDFQKQVVDPISAGNDEMKPALPDTAKSIFTDDDHVNVLLLSPKEPDKVPDGVDDKDGYKKMFNYDDKMNGDVKKKLQSILPDNTKYNSQRYGLPQNTDKGKKILEDNKDAQDGPEASKDWQDYVNNQALGHVLTVFSPTKDKPAYKVYLADDKSAVISDDWSSS